MHFGNDDFDNWLDREAERRAKAAETSQTEVPETPAHRETPLQIWSRTFNEAQWAISAGEWEAAEELLLDGLRAIEDVDEGGDRVFQSLRELASVRVVLDGSWTGSWCLVRAACAAPTLLDAIPCLLRSMLLIPLGVFELIVWVLMLFPSRRRRK